MVIAEDTDRVKKAVKAAHGLLRDPRKIKGTPFEGIGDLPLAKLIDTAHFAAKTESSLLQIADLCAYLILRRFMRQESSQPFFEQISPQLTWRAKDFGEPIGTEVFGGGSLF
jgi:hypothetical protein